MLIAGDPWLAQLAMLCPRKMVR
jgi:hypothetical protein